MSPRAEEVVLAPAVLKLSEMNLFHLGPIVVVAALVATSCASGRYGPAASGRVKQPPRTLKQLTVAERQAVLRRAHIWSPIDTQRLDMRMGPSGPGAFEPDQMVTCTFVYPPRPLSGQTEKFRCDLGNGEIVKVKFGRRNGEVYGVVAASRLLWALGFAVPRWYPVEVKCLDCPEDPWRVSRVEWFKGRPRFVAARTFAVAAVERDYPGEDIETPGFSGWAWPELEQIDAERGGAPRAHIDALKLMAVFLQHNDNKPVQQRLVCPQSQLRRDAAGNESCGTAQLVLNDVGATFSEGSFWGVGKVDLDKWRRAPVWRDATQCIGHLDRFLNGSLEHPVIGEPGRRFLAERLSLLSDAQLGELFRAARMDRRDGGAPADDVDRSSTIEDWVDAFKRRRDQIVTHRCASVS
jgi:hypothetical protein